MSRNSRQNQKSYTNVYHVILRSINQQEIFYDNSDRSKFLKGLKITKEKYQYDLYAYILMDNHVHLLIMDREDKLSKVIQSLATSYAMYFNKKYHRIGHVFYNRFKSKKIENLPYFSNVLRYIHFNCEKAGLCDFDKFYWSSYHEFFEKSTLVDTTKVLKIMELDKNEFQYIHEKYKKLKGFEKDNFELEDINLDDELVVQKIKEQLKLDNLVSIQNFDNTKRYEIISNILKIEGIKKRQLARILGVSERMIYRAIEKNKN